MNNKLIDLDIWALRLTPGLLPLEKQHGWCQMLQRCLGTRHRPSIEEGAKKMFTVPMTPQMEFILNRELQNFFCIHHYSLNAKNDQLRDILSVLHNKFLDDRVWPEQLKISTKLQLFKEKYVLIIGEIFDIKLNIPL